MLHGSTLNKVRNLEAAFERAGNTLLMNIDPLETQRTLPLSQVIHDDLNKIPVPTDFNKLIDLYPEDNRTNLDVAGRVYAQNFASRVGIENKKISIEGSNGTKFMNVNWKSRAGAVLNTMDSLTGNGTWSVVGSATGLKANSLYKLSGTASIEFDVVASGDGIQNTTQTALDLTDWDELADAIIPIYLGSTTNITSFTSIWGNDLTTNYWTSVAQTTQADGTAFKTGWNFIKVPWSTATETGTVNPATIDSFKLTVQSIGAISNIRVDNIIFSLGRNFDIKYYSKFLFQNSSGTYITRPTSDDNVIVLDNDSLQCYLLELLKACAQQLEGEDANFDIQYATKELHGDPSALDEVGRMGLYKRYRMEHPSQAQKAVTRYSSAPRFRR